MDYKNRISAAGFQIPEMSRLEIPRLQIDPPAKWMHERIVRSIIDFEKELDETHEVGARLVSFTANEVISVDDVGYWGPDMIIFHGRNADGCPAQLLQHYTQINVLLVAVKTQKPPNRIGFILEDRLAKKYDGEE